MIEITRRNYFLLRRILRNDPVFSDYKPGFASTIKYDGQVYQTIFPNTVGDKTIHVATGPTLGKITIAHALYPLVHNGEFVLLKDQYSIDLFEYQYGFFFNSGEEIFFRDNVIKQHNIPLKKLTELRKEGIEVLDNIIRSE